MNSENDGYDLSSRGRLSILIVDNIDKYRETAMKLTTKSEYSLLALIYMARQKNKGFVKMTEICTRCDIPKKYLEQLFLVLKRTGYLRAKRGGEGGYMLAMDPGRINLAEIIRLMDGALAPTESVSHYFYAETPLAKERKTLRLLKDIRDYISERLERTTLLDLM